ncbi:MAG: GIY-YIG nuclease family protein [Bacteroidota bacterium]
MRFFFYVLRSEVDGSSYKGQTSDLERRVKKHNHAESRSTKSRRPWKLVYNEEYQTRSEAVSQERFLKSPASGNQSSEELKIVDVTSERGAAR